MAIWCGFRGFYIGAAFCPSVFELSSFDFGLRPFLRVPFFRWGRWWWLRGMFLFVVLIWVKPILLTSRYYFYFCSVFYFWWSRFCWLWDTIFDPFFGCPHLGEAGLVDFEVLNYFLQCASFGRVGFIDSEAPILFLQCVLLLVKSISLTWRHDFDPFLGALI